MAKNDNKPDRKRDMTVGLLRQRRNLIGVSIILILYYVGNIELTQLSFLGNKIKLQNPNVVSYLLWFLFVYFLYRYWLYFKEEPKDRYDIDYNNLLDKLCTPIFKKIALKQNNQNHSKELLKKHVERSKFSLYKSGNYKKLSWLKAESFGFSAANPSKEDNLKDMEISAIYYEFCFIPLKVYACLKMSIKDSRFSDYYLPFYIAVFAVVTWLGSLVIEVISNCNSSN